MSTDVIDYALSVLCCVSMSVTKNGMGLPFILEIILSHIIPPSSLQFLLFCRYEKCAFDKTVLRKDRQKLFFGRLSEARHILSLLQ